MQVYLLIDTTNWKRLVSPTGIDRNLSILKYLTSSGQVTLLLPEALEEEWLKHREIERAALRKKMRSHQKTLELYNLTPDEITAKNEAAFNTLQTQIDTIDELLGGSLKIQDSDKSIRQVHAHQKTAKLDKANRLPPFHKKADSFNDARLIFSTLEFLQENEMEHLYILSDNHNEFGSPLDPENEIHPHFRQLYSSIQIAYFSNIATLIKRLNEDGLELIEPPQESLPVIKSSIPIDPSLSILDQLYYYLETRFKEFFVLPKHLFTKDNPILIKGKPLRQEANHLVSDNPEVYQLLHDAFDISQLAPEQNKKRTEIIKWLLNNWLLTVSMPGAPDNNLTYTPATDKPCDCLLCLYKRFDFVQLFHDLENDPTADTPTELSRLAYAQYLSGKLKDSLATYKTLYENSMPKSGQLNYLTQYNSKILGRVLDFYGDNLEDTKKLVAETKKINLDEVYRRNENSIDKPILDWLHNAHFAEQALSEIIQLTNDIRGFYFSKSNGSHEDTRDLLEKFHSLSEFIHQNGVVNDLGSTNNEIANAYTEGIFASLGCQPGMGGRLVHLDDHLIRVLQLNIHPEVIRKFSNRYKIRSIKTGGNLADFHSGWQRLFTQLPELDKRYMLDPNSRFWHKYEQIALTTITIFSLIETEEAQTNLFLEKLIQFLNEQNIIRYFNAEAALRFFIDKKKKQISAAGLEKLLNLWISNPKYRTIQVLDLLLDMYSNKGEKVNLSESQFQMVQSFSYAGSPDYDEQIGWETLCYLFGSVQDNQHQNSIGEYIRQNLHENFTGEKYNEACMLNAIQPAEELNALYFEEIKKVLSKDRNLHMWWHDEFFHDPRVDAFINFCFKYQLVLDEEFKKQIIAFDIYYEWLLNMDHFDYAKFNPAWLRNSFTYYYKSEYRKSQQLKTFLMNYIRENFDDHEAQRVFMFTYAYDD